MEKNITYSPPDDDCFRVSHFPGKSGIYTPLPEYHIPTRTDSMHPILNPNKEKIQELIQLSDQKAAKWLKDLDTGNLWYWPASWVVHANMASKLRIKDYEKGIVIDGQY